MVNPERHVQSKWRSTGAKWNAPESLPPPASYSLPFLIYFPFVHINTSKNKIKKMCFLKCEYEYSTIYFFVCKDTLSSVLFGSLQEALWLHLHFFNDQHHPKAFAALYADRETSCRPDVLCCSPGKTCPQHHGPQRGQERSNKTVVKSSHLVSLSYINHCFVFVYSLSKVCRL